MLDLKLTSASLSPARTWMKKRSVEVGVEPSQMQAVGPDSDQVSRWTKPVVIAILRPPVLDRIDIQRGDLRAGGAVRGDDGAEVGRGGGERLNQRARERRVGRRSVVRDDQHLGVVGAGADPDTGGGRREDRKPLNQTRCLCHTMPSGAATAVP